MIMSLPNWKLQEKNLCDIMKRGVPVYDKAKNETDIILNTST